MSLSKQALFADETILADVDSVIFANVEDGRLFMVTSALLPDNSDEIAAVLELVQSAGLAQVSEEVCESVLFFGGYERRRWYA